MMASTGISSAYTNPYAAVQKPTPPTQASQLNTQLLGIGATVALAVAAGIGTAGLSYGSNFKDVFQHETIEKKLATEGKPQWLSMEETIKLAEAIKAEDPEGWQEKLSNRNAFNQKIKQERKGINPPIYTLHLNSLQDKKLAEDVLPEFRNTLDERIAQAHVKHFEGFFKPWTNDVKQLKEQGLRALAHRTEQARHNGYWYAGMVALLGFIFVEWQSSKQKNNYPTNY
ncbi:MAG: hypothetical protein H2174_07765 [Vampirovibrio sp.]|nr:hypothetical protein [Vampirovibrio sp.]